MDDSISSFLCDFLCLFETNKVKKEGYLIKQDTIIYYNIGQDKSFVLVFFCVVGGIFVYYLFIYLFL